MNNKEAIQEIIKNINSSFTTQTVINECTTRKIKTSKSYITKILKELGFVFDTHHKVWEKQEEMTKEASVVLPETMVVFTPQIIVYIFNTKENKIEKNELHFLGMFFNKEDAEEHLKLQVEFYSRIAKTIQNNNPELKVNLAVNNYEMMAHKSEKGYTFATEYRRV